MIILKDITCCKYRKSVEVELPRANMVIDPRPNGPHNFPRFQCEYHDNGTTVTLTRTDNGAPFEIFWFRVYDPTTETVPSFDSTIYTYLGEDGEKAPRDTTVLTIHPSVTVIKGCAFEYCREIKKCFMHDGVHTIEERAFLKCSAMKVIRLSRSLTQIRDCAFSQCSSLEAVFLPPAVTNIDKWAFKNCQNLRIFPLPLNIDISQIGNRMLQNSHIFFQTTQIQEYANRGEDETNRIHQEIIHFYHDQGPPLHKACLDTHVTRQTIQQCIDTHGRATASIRDHDGMTPLHILVMNPHANMSAILACFELNMISLFVGDSRGNTPMDYLGEYHEGIECHTSLVCKLIEHWDAPGSSQDRRDTPTNKNLKRKRANDESTL